MKSFAAALLWLSLCLPFVASAQQLAAIPALDSPVVDTTGTLDATAKQQLEQQALALQQRKGSQLQVLMVPSTEPEDIEQYTQRVFDAWKLGRKGVDDGVLVVVAKDDHKLRIQPGYGLEGAIPDITAGRVIREYMVPKFRDGDYAGGVADGTAQLVKLIDGEPLPEPMSDQGGEEEAGRWLGSLFAAFIAAQMLRSLFGFLPAGVRALLGAGGAGGIAWFFSQHLLALGIIGALLGFFIGLTSRTGGRWAGNSRSGGFGSGGWGGGSSGGGWSGGDSGGGWSGGGGSSGGGGASGSW